MSTEKYAHPFVQVVATYESNASLRGKGTGKVKQARFLAASQNEAALIAGMLCPRNHGLIELTYASKRGLFDVCRQYAVGIARRI